MIDLSLILLFSVLLQVIAVIFALRLIPLTGRALAWIILSGAFILMASRRVISLLHQEGWIKSNWLHELSAESVALVISSLLVAGILLIRSIFEQQAKASEELKKLSLAVEQNPSSTIITNTEGIIEYVNPRFCEVSGYQSEEVIGRKTSILKSEFTQNDLYHNLWKTITTGNIWKGEFCNKCKNGDLRWERACISPVKSEKGNVTHYVAVLEDITEQREQRAALEYLAMHDALTGLANRTLLHDRLSQAIINADREGHTLAVLLMDLDNFKEINDTLGHHVGDRILREIGRRILRKTARGDTVARMGGDEFMVLLATGSEEDAMEYATGLVEKFQVPFNIDSRRFELGASIGIALYPEDGRNADELIQKSDVAMYAAKRSKEHIVRYHQDLDGNDLGRLELIGDLRHAAEKDEFELHFQPRMNVRKGIVEGIEALLRWKHPRLGMLYPDEFIPIAEETGIISLVTRWVLERAIRTLAEWHEPYPHMEISINISARDLVEPDLPEFIQTLLHQNRIAPVRLILEITESALMLYTRETYDTLEKLKRIGIRVAIDDFGTGYSSMLHLKELPVSELKIDKSFVMHMIENENDAVIVRSMIDLAHNLGLKVVAEGIEDRETLDILEILGCDSGQGYYFSRPLQQEALLQYVRDQTQSQRVVRM